MEVAYATRKQQLLAECHVAPEIFHQVMPRLETFISIIKFFSLAMRTLLIFQVLSSMHATHSHSVATVWP
jgi:hypothetical protein